MQRLLIGAGVVVAAIVLAILLMPGVEPTPIAENARRDVKAVALKGRAAPGNVVGRKVEADRTGGDGKAVPQLALAGQRSGRNSGRTKRYAAWLQKNGLAYDEHIAPLNDLDALLADFEGKDAIVLREQLGELRKLTQSTFEDPDAYKPTYKLQAQFLQKLESSTFADDPEVLAAKQAYVANTERAHSIFTKL